MRCPNCDHPIYQPSQPCPQCHFANNPDLIEELARIDWLLTEIGTWLSLGIQPHHYQLLQQKYVARQRELEIILGLRLPPFTPAEAQNAWPDLIKREILLQQLGQWLTAGLIIPVNTQTLIDQVTEQVGELTERLEGHTRPEYPHTDTEHLEVTSFLIEAADHLRQQQGLAAPPAEQQILTPLVTQKEQLEIKLGLRSAPKPEPESQAAIPALQPSLPPTIQPSPLPTLPPPVPSPLTPAPPLRDRLWRTLLSERTLHALLFLGIFLLFAAALSFVIWGWQDFSAPVRVAIPTGFTAIFFALGWYVRTKTPLYRSGIALSAIAALLIPIDFYTVYVNFHISVQYWPWFWLLTSLACLTAYLGAAFLIRSRFFGYLVGTAAGSTVLALVEIAHQAAGFSHDWRTAGLSLLALGMIILSTTLEKRQKTSAGITSASLDSPSPPELRISARYIFIEPFRYLALLTVAVLMPLTFGWRYLNRATFDILHYALTVNWWVGGLVFAWGAIHYRSRSLGLLAAIALPVATYLAQAAIFHQIGLNPAWHALGWALLVPWYFFFGHKWLIYLDDPIVRGHGRTATGWGVALLIAAALWSLTDLTNGAAAACSHAILAGAVVLAAYLWQKPTYLYAASLLALSTVTFTMSELDIPLAQVGVGWASLAIAHIIIALNLGTGFPSPDSAASEKLGRSVQTKSDFVTPVVVAGYAIAALALTPSLLPYDGHRLAYTLANWLGLTLWGARLAHVRQPGFAMPLTRSKSIFHWFTALPLPIWLWILFTNQRPLDFSLPLALALLAWGMVALSYRLAQAEATYRWPWYLTGLLVGVIAPIVGFAIAPQGYTPGLTLLSAGLLLFADAITCRRSFQLAPAGLVTAWGVALILDRMNLSADAITFALTFLVSLYILLGLQTERQKSSIFTRQFFIPLYLTAHFIALLALFQIYGRPVTHLFSDIPWSDVMRYWGAASQLLLALTYTLYAWGTYRERWGHLAVWLMVAAGGFMVITYSRGQGSSAASVALMAAVLVLFERGLYWLRQRREVNRKQAFLRLSWRLYRRPLLWAGWTVSAGAIGLALIRNLWLLDGGRIQQIWAVAGLTIVTGLYALSARLFRRARFVWLAALLSFAPWTILTNLGWFTAYRPSLPGFALSWTILAWSLFMTGLILSRWTARAYILPLKSVAHVLIPFSLLWGVADVDTSRFTVALAIGLYSIAAILDYQQLKRTNASFSVIGKTKFLYPAVGLVPVWCVYLLAWLFPGVRHEHYGLMLLAFGPVGLVAGQWLKRVAPKPAAASGYALPAYLTGYGCLLVGTLLTAHESPLLALVLLFDAFMLIISARLFRNPWWLYPAGIAVPLSLLAALHTAGAAGNRQGWWLIGLAWVYLVITWALRRIRLTDYGAAPLTISFALIAFGLPPSSQDQTGALWGYGGAALFYALTAFWLHQPLLLTPAGALTLVPYAIGLQKSSLASEYYGLALFPGAVTALILGRGLDYHYGGWRDFPWGNPAGWARAMADRLLGWWGLPLYTGGFVLAIASPLFAEFKADLMALSFALLIPIFGWAIYYFRLRVWLLALAIAGHLAAVYYLAYLGWWRYPVWAWQRFLLVTLITILVALFIEKWRHEKSPLQMAEAFKGWSHLLYIILSLDIIIGQIFAFKEAAPGTIISLTHALILAVLASFWLSRLLPYFSLTLGVATLIQWLSTLTGPIEGLPVALAGLALGYGLIGYAITFMKQRLPNARQIRAWIAIWDLPLQRSGILLSWGTLVLTAWLGLDLAGWTIRALFGLSFRQIVDLSTVQMVVQVFALLGLLYLAAASVHRWLRLGYVAIGMLLTAWMLHAFYIQEWENIQWYAAPVGLYLLAIAFLEWQRGHKTLARWIDYAAMVLMLGSLFWQTLLFGWEYALLLGLEGFAGFWWGSARRLRRFFYAGMVAVMLATVGQLLNSWQSINQWIVFGIIGLLLVLVAIAVERKLDSIKAWQQILESWE